MFAKFLIILAVGCTLTVADSTRKNDRHRLVRRETLQPTRGIFGTLGGWISKATKVATYPYRKAYDILVQTSQGVTDFGIEKVKNLMAKYYEIKLSYQQNLDNIKNKMLQRAIGELQKVINVLADEAHLKTCEQLKESNKNISAAGKEALDQLEKELEDAVDAELKSLQDELANWQLEADPVVKENEQKRKQNVPVR